MTTRPRVLAVLGPTASGKSALGLGLAERVGGEIVACDSQQVYIGMDIGTAKPTPEERRRVPHHGLDLVRPDEPFHAARWAAVARAAIADITARGRLPIVVGGTGLYNNVKGAVTITSLHRKKPVRELLVFRLVV